MMHEPLIDRHPELVHDCDNPCQELVDPRAGLDEKFESSAFRINNCFFGNAIVEAVKLFNACHDSVVVNEQAWKANQPLGFFAHAFHHCVKITMLAFAAIKSGNVHLIFSINRMPHRNMAKLRRQIERFLADLIKRNFNAEQFSSIATVNNHDDLLTSAMGNLWLNAFKFSGKGGIVMLGIGTRAVRNSTQCKNNAIY
ncbi:hypothetical protein H8L32_13310 [Undibacterium sp. CY18W]|uniref:Uncharacterized protein n=1 Tax=Undibacterium hunanense TaxID=2762292 RepID=A0ABR6ZS71_9BURK|nr:hypothetical protein [Undibacterium hunanense]MBC3918464.1 hypothetical protein [Undibacterium hunanense]